MNDTLIPSRREVLKAGSLVVAFSLTDCVGSILAQPQETSASATPAKPVVLTEVDSFLAIDADGIVTV